MWYRLWSYTGSNTARLLNYYLFCRYSGWSKEEGQAHWWYRSSLWFEESQIARPDEKYKQHQFHQLPKVQNWGKIKKDQPFQVECRGIENSPKGLYDSSNPDKTCWRTQKNHGQIYRKY